MHEEDYKAKILELETALQEAKDREVGLVEKHKTLEDTVKEKDVRISNLLDKNSEMFLMMRQPEANASIEETPVAPEPQLSIEDILGDW